MKLKVLAGAKQGAEVPLKKSKFVIGRASDCSLRAGSDAISRHHCVILRRDSGPSVRDLGSRNGTYVNGEKIDAETPLNDGDRIRVGPLEFVFEAPSETGAEKKPEKMPKVKDVAEALERTAAKAKSDSSATIAEDDISSWLIEGPSSEQAMHETQSFRMDETHAMTKAEAEQATDQTPLEVEPGENSSVGVGDEDPAAADGSKAGSGKGSRSGKKAPPGKLPKRPEKPATKDSREAAADILRELARRR